MAWEIKVVGDISRTDPVESANVIREVLREEVPRVIRELGGKIGDRAMQAEGGSAGKKWSEITGRKRRGPRVVVDVKEQGVTEDVRAHLVKCLDPTEGEVRVRNITHRRRNFVVEVHLETDLEKLRRIERIRKAGFEVNGEP